MTRLAVGLAVLALSASGVACARAPAAVSTAPVPGCAVGDTRMVREVLYFGRNRPDGGTVSDAEWRAFLDEVVTPRFPAGLTVVEAMGQWKGENGMVEQERSVVVTLLHDGGAAARQGIGDLTSEYKRRFHQEAVLRERMATCARFE